MIQDLPEAEFMLYLSDEQITCFSIWATHGKQKTKTRVVQSWYCPADFFELLSIPSLKMRRITDQKDIRTHKNKQGKTSPKHIN